MIKNNTLDSQHMVREDENIIIDHILNSLKKYISEKEDYIKKGGEDFSQVEFFGRLLLLKVFQDMGYLNKSGAKYLKDELKIKLGLIPKYEQFYEILLKILEKEKFIKIQDNSILTTDKVESTDLKKNIDNLKDFKDNLIKNFPDMQSHFILLEICLSNYKKILNGEKNANEVMFPVFSMDLVKGIFIGNKMADYFNYLIALCVKSYIQIISDKEKKTHITEEVKKIKILEIGAGTGGTSVFVLDAIINYSNIIEFYYTDISKVFVRNGQKKYKEKYPFAFFKKFDIENGDIESQSFELESFDVIFASNVIHATKNIKYTINNIKKILKNNGIFLLNEVTNSQDFVNLTFGLMDDWWKFEDKEIRLPNTPLLSTKQWKKVLISEGFKNINLVSSSHQEKPDSFSQSLIISQKD
ncbi:MAG: class I SAM-dependent methyltransferase [Spirochaetes bacterium]|nr:class I SAM-dependent methyltransferase [Spirochaetota bacterium]